MNRFTMSALALICIPAIAVGAPEKTMPQHESVPAFEQLKALVGEWQGTGDEGAERMSTSFHLTSKGSALVEELAPSAEDAMVNVYHADGDEVVMTHYCGGGNQPRMRCKKDGESLVFVMTDITNWKKGEPRMTAVTIRMIDADHMAQDWTSESDGKSETFTMEFVRKH
jgi:hypothetical protein